MSEGASKGRGCLMAAIAVGLFIAVSCGCAGIIGVTMGPSMIMDAVVEDAPLESDHPASSEAPKALRQRAVDELRSDSRTTRLTGPELTAMMRDQLGDSGQGGVSIEGGVATVDFSMNLAEKPTDPAKWVNLHAVGSLTFEGGRVTMASMDEVVFSGWDLGIYLEDDAQLVSQINSELEQRRATDPDVAKALDTLEKLQVAGDAVEITVTAEGAAKVQDAR